MKFQVLMAGIVLFGGLNAAQAREYDNTQMKCTFNATRATISDPRPEALPLTLHMYRENVFSSDNINIRQKTVLVLTKDDGNRGQLVSSFEFPARYQSLGLQELEEKLDRSIESGGRGILRSSYNKFKWDMALYAKNGIFSYDLVRDIFRVLGAKELPQDQNISSHVFHHNIGLNSHPVVQAHFEPEQYDGLSYHLYVNCQDNDEALNVVGKSRYPMPPSPSFGELELINKRLQASSGMDARNVETAGIKSVPTNNANNFDYRKSRNAILLR